MSAFAQIGTRMAARMDPSRVTTTGLIAMLFLAFALLANAAQARPAPDSFADLAERVSPAVVNISIEREAVARGMNLPPNLEGTPFQEFFERFFDQNPHMRPMPGPDQRGDRSPISGVGSGFIVDPEGYVVTNHHVAGDAEAKIQVTLTDGSSYDATLLGSDENTDLALLKVEADRPLPHVSFGDSDGLRVGDWIMAVGNPFGLGGSVTAGIVSARGRDLNAGPFDDFIQTDAAINRGNSGGPSFDMDGRVVGVNTAIYSPNGGSVGIGFAIPANLAKRVIGEIRERGSFDRGWLGVRIQQVSPDIADSIGLDRPRGALVVSIGEDAPVAGSELRAGDVIIEFDGQSVEEMRDLPRIVGLTTPGKPVPVRVWRDGGPRAMRLTVGRQAGEQVAARAPATRSEPEPVQTERLAELGLALANASPEVNGQFGLPESVSGLVVVEIDADSRAAEALRVGDAIVGVNQRPIRERADLERAADEARANGRRAILLQVNRAGAELFVPLRLPEA